MIQGLISGGEYLILWGGLAAIGIGVLIMALFKK